MIFYHFILASIRGSDNIGLNYRSNGSDGLASLLERHGFDDVSGLPWIVGASGRLAFHCFANIIGYLVIYGLAMGMDPYAVKNSKKNNGLC